MQENLAESEENSKALDAIRTGIGVREDFWSDFLLVINNSEALSELLDIPSTKISSWHSKVNDALSKVKAADETPEVKKKTTMMSTGDPDFSDDDADMGAEDEIV
jgi:hypothetical protein